MREVKICFLQAVLQPHIPFQVLSVSSPEWKCDPGSRKAKLFRSLLSTLPRKDAVIAEVGMGSFPNAPYFSQSGAPSGTAAPALQMR